MPRTQAARRSKTQNALLESAAIGLSDYGYGNLVLERVAADAGVTRGALYHHFEDKQRLAIAVVAWKADAWQREVGAIADREPDPVDALIAMARAHASYFRREQARVIMTLRVEFRARDHPVGRAADEGFNMLVERCARLIATGRLRESIAPGPPARTLARAFFGAIEGAVIQLTDRARYDELLAENLARGVLGISEITR